ncbi:MAG: 23S rRNA (pseudouridine(1915)-N(3))-methyltransferase RlmH [Bacilli bacterium]|nr:23S rRNA (pseudouridine(1915)-N(3))-methyltransferase RlmH [Bacilli bacterium]
MKIKIIAIGMLKEKYLKDMSDEYTKRLSKYTKVEIIEIKEENDTHPNAKEIEGKKILSSIKPKDYVIALTLNKKEYTSEEFATWLNDKFMKTSELVFVIGGSLGLCNSVTNRANECLTLSKLTFTHQMSRIILLEQIYRGFKINHHEKYHK